MCLIDRPQMSNYGELPYPLTSLSVSGFPFDVGGVIPWEATVGRVLPALPTEFKHETEPHQT